VDIYSIAEYAWYEWVKFRDTAAKFPVSKIQLGRDVGAAIDIGPAMARNIMKKNGQVMYRTYVISITPDEMQSPSERKEREEFDAAIGKKYGLQMNEADFKDKPDYADFVKPTYDCYEDDGFPASKMPDIYHVKNKDDGDTYDQHVVSQVRVPIGDEILTGKVVWRKRELNGTERVSQYQLNFGHKDL
jgi:hypothetical protein